MWEKSRTGAESSWDLNVAREELAAKALHGQKMESLGVLASGVAHDFNNILSPILTYTHLLQQNELSLADRTTMLREITAATKRVGHLAQQVLSFARPSDEHYRNFDVAPVVGEVVSLLRASLPPSVAIESTGQVGRMEIFGDATQLHQLLLNLGINAGHAMQNQDGILSISTNVDELEGKRGSSLGLVQGRYVQFRVQDSGCGISPENLDRIFEPFFTTRPAGEGSGMGLASAHGIVRRHGGTITVESELGQGTVFRVWLPCTRTSDKPCATPRLLGSPVHGGRVLVVDDDDFSTLVDSEVTRLSTYASNDDNAWGACVSTWTVGGAAIGELASKTCVLVGVATIETGVGAVAAAVCVGADVTQADALLGAAIGYVSGYLACSASSSFPSFLDSFNVFHADADVSGENDTSADELEDWITPECRSQYDEYKYYCKQPRACSSAALSCGDFMNRFQNAKLCAELRDEHLYHCPHPDSFDWDGHKEELGIAYAVAQKCQAQLCNFDCIDLIPVDQISTLGEICGI